MAGSGSKDKGGKEQKKKPKHNLKEKRKLKQDKKQKSPFSPGGQTHALPKIHQGGSIQKIDRQSGFANQVALTVDVLTKRGC